MMLGLLLRVIKIDSRVSFQNLGRRKRRRRNIGEERETREEFGGVERVGPKVNLVEGRRKRGAAEDVVDGVALNPGRHLASACRQ